MVSFFSLAISALWLNFHLSKLSSKNVDFVNEVEAISKSVPVASLDDSNIASVPPKKPISLQNSSLPTESPIDESSPIGMTSENMPVSLANRSKHPFIKWIVFVAVLSCFIGIVIGYLAGGGYLSPSLVPDSPYIQQLKEAESDASSKGYSKGYHDGRDDGYVAGKSYGYNEGYNDGLSSGFQNGSNERVTRAQIEQWSKEYAKGNRESSSSAGWTAEKVRRMRESKPN